MQYATSSMDWLTHHTPTEDPVLGDEGEYPSDIELARIENWDGRDLTGLFAYMRARWRWPSYWRTRGHFHHVSTGGWSGHEDMLAAFERNRFAWIICWAQVRRGGHFLFDLHRLESDHA